MRGRFEGGHGINKLYDNLNLADRQDIEARPAALIAKNPHYADIQRLDSIQSRADEMFFKGRYWHEGETPRTDSRGHIGNAGAAPLSDAVFELRQLIHPDWWEKRKRFQIDGLDDGTQPA